MANHNPDDDDLEYYDNNMYYGRNYDYNRNEFGRETDYYGRRQWGPYSGYGPAGYSRPDDKILQDINDRLTWNGQIDATDISVTVTAGTVVLNGSVDSRRDKRLAEDIADTVSGVWDVQNQLRVRNRGYYRGFQGTANRREIRPGMEVVDSQGAKVGEVKQVRENNLLLERPRARGLYIPFSACQVRGGEVVLNIEAADVDRQGWQVAEGAA
jgi:hypothetical protein